MFFSRLFFSPARRFAASCDRTSRCDTAAWSRSTRVGFATKARGPRRRAGQCDVTLFDSPTLRGSEALR